MSRHRITITLEAPYEAQRHKNLRAAGYALMNAAESAQTGADALLWLLALAIVPVETRAYWRESGEFPMQEDLTEFIATTTPASFESVEIED